MTAGGPEGTSLPAVANFVADQTASLGYTGTFSIGLAGGTSADISITSSMSLQDVADTINNQTSTTNVQASVIEVSSGSYELVLSGTKDAADIQTSGVSGDDVLNKLGVTIVEREPNRWVNGKLAVEGKEV